MRYKVINSQYKSDPDPVQCRKECDRVQAQCEFNALSSWWATVLGAGAAGGVFSGGAGILPAAGAGEVGGLFVFGNDYIQCGVAHGSCEKDCPPMN